MAKILVVDDEQGYRNLISQVLSSEGHEVRTSASGREALDLGARYRPDVLVTDWMLKDDIHGLHVVDVLRAILPDIRAIMITGFPADDLRNGAKKAGVHAFLEKPFDAMRIRQAVQAAIIAVNEPTYTVSMAMIEVDSANTIVFANSAARSMMAATLAGPDAKDLASLLAEDVEPALEAAKDRVIAVLPRSIEHKHWHLRTQKQPANSSRLIILRRWDEPQHLGGALTRMLLGAENDTNARWPLYGRVLIVDDESWIRTVSVSLLERAGAGCYAVDTATQALRLLANDDDIRYVILDCDMPNTDSRALVEKIRAVRPNVTIVGNSGSGHRDDFAAMGVKHYLDKPWRIEDLINTLAGRIGKCVSCGIPMPLRRAKYGETASRWECSNCNARYQAVLDLDSPENTRSNVRQIPRG